MKNMKKLLAMILCFAIITATIAFNIAVTAEAQPRYFTVLNTTFETDAEVKANNGFYCGTSNAAAHALDSAGYKYKNYDNISGAANGQHMTIPVVQNGIGNNSSKGVIKLGYDGDASSSSNYRPVFSLRCSVSYNGRNAGQSFQTVAGTAYKVSLYYKAVTINTPVSLWMRTYSGSLTNAAVDSNSDSVKLVDISSTTGGYVRVEAVITAKKKENLVIFMKAGNYAAVGGTAVYVDDVTVMEQKMLESSLGDQTFEDATDMSGFNTYEDWEISTEQNHTESGSKSARIKIDAGNNTGANRPRMILKVAGNNFVAKKGSTYVVSFWVYSSEVINNFNWYIYSSVSASLGSSRVGQQEVEKGGVSLAVGWNKIVQKITISGYNSSEDNYLQLGLTDGNAQSGYTTKYFYVDDIKVQDIAEKVTSTLVTQDFTGISTITGKPSSTVISNTNHPAGGGGSAQITNTGYKSGVDTSQFYIPGSNEYTRLCGEYEKRYRLSVSVRATDDITAKIRWFGTTTLSDQFNYATNHRVIAETDVELAEGEWTDITLTGSTIVDIFENKNVYFTLGATLADNTDSTTGYTILFDNISVNAVTKPGTPGVPVIENHSDDSITVKPISGGEYSLDNTNWQDSNVFTDLTPWQTYTVYQRIKATATAIPSDGRLVSYQLILNGDLNMDSEINAFDITLLVDTIIGAEINIEYSEPAGDVNADDSIDIRDLITIKKKLSISSNVDAFIPIG